MLYYKMLYVKQLDICLSRPLLTLISPDDQSSTVYYFLTQKPICKR